MFGSFISKGTGLAVSMKPADPTVAQAQLENGTFDAFITVGLYEHPSDTCVKLGTLLTGIVVTKSHPLAKKTIMTLSDLTAFPAGESSVFDNFNESVYRVYRKRRLISNFSYVKNTASENSRFTEKQRGYFFTALLPMYDQMSASMYRTIPIAPAEQVSIPLCIVSLKNDITLQYHRAEAFLVQSIQKLSMGR